MTKRFMARGPLIVRYMRGYELVIEKGWVHAREPNFRVSDDGASAYVFVASRIEDVESGGGRWFFVGDVAIYSNRLYKAALEWAKRVNEAMTPLDRYFGGAEAADSLIRDFPLEDEKMPSTPFKLVAGNGLRANDDWS